MSVWFTESFRGQVFWDVARLEGSNKSVLSEFAVRCPVYFEGGTIAATGQFDEVVFPRGLADELPEEFFHRVFFDSVRAGRPTIKGGKVTKKLLESGATFTTGYSAVLALYGAFTKEMLDDARHDVAEEHKFLSLFTEHAFRAQAGLLKTTAEVAADAAARVNKRGFLEASAYQRLAWAARTVINLRWRNRVRKQAQSHPKAMENLENFAEDAGLPDDWTLYYDGWLTYLRLGDAEDTEWIALTTVDLDRLQQMLISTSMLALHEAVWPCTAGNDPIVYRHHKRKIWRLFDEAISAAAKSPRDAGELCRDMRKCFNTYLSMAAGELSDDATDDMLREIKVKKYGKFLNSRKFIAALADMPFDLAQDLGRIYKLLPAPDYDIGESFAARQAQHLAMNPYREIVGANPCNLHEFEQYYRRLLTLTLVKKNKGKGVGKCRKAVPPRWWKEYVDKGVLPAKLSAVDDIDLTGVATYKERSDDNPDTLKDSAVCEEDLDDVFDTGDESFRRRNMLLRYLFDETCPTVSKARYRLSRKAHVHRVGFKMEAHKPVARLFFIGNYSDRLVQSEMEENVHRVAMHCPGYMIGQSTEFKTKKIMGMVAPRLTHEEQVYFLNFDISAWSPGMRDDIQRISHNAWAEVFDRQEFRFAHKINEKSTIVLAKRGYEAAYVNPGANLEGYNGKEMTFLHCALMGYSVYRYRRETGHIVTIPLAAYIDDGLASFTDKAKAGPARFLKFAEIVEQTYQSLGFLLERSKCFLSDSFAIFLNEIYLGGQHITYGLRAIMRVGTTAFEKHETLSARANTYLSGAQGSMKAGLDVVSSLICYMWLIGRMLLIYGVKEFMDARAAVLYAFCPRGLGGLGAGTVVAVCTNLVTDGLTEGIAALQELSRAYPGYAGKVAAILRQDVVVRSDTAVMLNPRSVEAPRKAMSENRLRSSVARALLKTSLARRARNLVRLYKCVKVDELSKAMIGPNVALSDVVLQDVLAATPLSLIESLVRKFDSARTMANLIGSREFSRITRANLADGLQSMANFRRI